MKTKLFVFVVMLATAGTTRAADTLTWQQLAARPELWPREVSLTHKMSFQGGQQVAAGQHVSVEQIKSDEIDLVTADGKLNFAADPDETDALSVAGAAYAKLTPKQRTLTYAAIAQQKDLWPAHITLGRTFQVGGSQALNAGDQYPVQSVLVDRVTVVVQRLNSTFDIAVKDTDLMAQARAFVEDPQAGPRLAAQQQVAQQAAQPKQQVETQQTAALRVLKELDGHLVSSVSGKAEPLDPASQPKYLVFLRGSSTCPFTRKFAPTLVAYYNRMKATHPEFEVIWIMTESPEDTGKFARALGFSWRALGYDDTPVVPEMNNQIDNQGRLPQLIVMDPAGHVIANGVRDDAPKALAQLDALLKHSGQ